MQNCGTKEKKRLQVYLAECGVASRRTSEKIIVSGRVSVNGKTITELGSKVSGDEIITVDGKRVFPEEKKYYILLNKPVGYVCSLSDELGRATAADILKPFFSARLYNVGRLDMLSCGAIIFTNDGMFADFLEHPSSGIEKEYVVETSCSFQDSLLEQFKNGVKVEGVFYKALKASRIGKYKMSIVLTEGKNREVRRVLKYFNVKIKKLIRVRIGEIRLNGLQSGSFRELTDSELKSFKKAPVKLG